MGYRGNGCELNSDYMFIRPPCHLGMNSVQSILKADKEPKVYCLSEELV